LDVALPYELDPRKLSKLSLQPARVKAHTLELAPEGWFSVQDYLKYRFESIDPRFVGEGRVLEAAEELAPREQALSMRLLRYHRQGLLARRRYGHRFLYRLTEKGKRRGLFLGKHRESIHEHLPYAKLSRPTGPKLEIPEVCVGRQVKLPGETPVSSPAPDTPPRCGKCGASLPSRHLMVCPHCHKLAYQPRPVRSS
jgi:hypothetical protein